MTIFESPTQQPVSLTLSALEFDVLWEHLGFDHMPLVLKVPSPGKTYAERAVIVNRTWSSLTSKGLATGPAQPIAELVNLLSPLDRPEREVDARLTLDREVRALGAARARRGVLATLVGEQVTLKAANAEALPSEVLALLPPRQAGQGRLVNVPSSELEAAAVEAQTSAQLADELIRRGVNSSDAQTLARMADGAGHRGQFGVAAREQGGERHRANRVIGFFDTPQGRYLQFQRANPGESEWSTIAPADHQLLVRQLTELLAEVS